LDCFGEKVEVGLQDGLLKVGGSLLGLDKLKDIGRNCLLGLDKLKDIGRNCLLIELWEF
jgi:hypothetical protein